MAAPSRRASGWLRRWGPLLLLLLVPVAWFPGALPGPRVVSADDHLTVHHAWGDPAEGRVRHPQLSDPPLQLAALRQAVVRELRAGAVPLWNPDLYGGAPLAADAQSAPASPLTWLHALLPEDVAQDADVGARLLAMGLGMALLAVHLGAGPWGGAVAGAAAMTSPYLSVWLLHPHAAVLCWLPWLLLSVERRSLIGSALATALLVSGGHPGTLVHALDLAAAWWLLRGRAVPVIFGVILGLCMSAPVWWLVLEHGLASTTAAARGGTPLPPAALLDLVWPGWWGHPATESFRGTHAWANGQLHPGLGALFLAGLALSHRLGRRLWLASGVCVLLALSGLLPGPLDHARLASVGVLLLALAAGLGARRLGTGPGLLALLLVVATGLHARRHDQGSLPAEAHAPEPAPWVAVVREAAGDGRVLGLDWVLQPNTGARVGLRDLRGYDLPISDETQALMAALSPRPQGPWYPVAALPELGLLRRGDVRLVLSHAGDEPVGIDAFEALALPSGAPVSAWRVPGGWGRAWIRSSSGPRVPLDLTAPSGRERRVDLSEVGAGQVVISETWHGGWRAWVDGEPAAISRVDGVFMGVGVSAEHRELRLLHDPAGWRWGRWLALLGWLAWGVLALSRLRPGRVGQPRPRA